MSSDDVSVARRSDIDGLRAIAALAITVFHIAPSRLPGGFTGVDVFFVISGFLIIGNIFRSQAAGRFRLVDFYLGRARRLFPALFVMMAVVAATAWFVLLPSELEQLGASTVSSALYVSNFFYLSQSGYFDAALQSDPLLHTWSLAVEEQFYLLAPVLLLLALTSFGKRTTILALAGTGLASLLLCIWLTGEAPSWAFYLSPTRIWEFAVGGLIAVLPTPRMAPLWRNALATVGLLLIATGLVFIDQSQTFPGVLAIVPVVGTGAVVLAGSSGDTVAARALSLPPLQWIGRASYSIYLWHWPIVVFYSLSVETIPSIVAQVGLLAVSLALGFVSYWLIERGGRQLFAENRIALVASGLATLAFVAAGVASVWSGGFSARFPAEVQRYASYLKYDEDQLDLDRRCFIQTRERVADFSPAACVRLAGEKPNVLVVGDSQAAHYARALAEVFPDWSVSEIASSGCRPLVGGKGERRCTEMMKLAFDKHIAAGVFDAVIIAGRWRAGEAAEARKSAEFAARYAKQVIVFGPIIEYDVSLPRLLAVSARDGTSAVLDRARNLAQIRSTDDALRQALIGAPARYVSIMSAICPDAKCTVTIGDGVPLQHDYGHLTLEGAKWLLSKLRYEEALLSVH